MKRILLFESDAIISWDLRMILNEYKVDWTKNISDLKTKLREEQYDLLILHLTNTEQEFNVIRLIRKNIHIPILVMDPLNGKYYPYHDTFIKMPIAKDELFTAISKNLVLGCC